MHGCVKAAVIAALGLAATFALGAPAADAASEPVTRAQPALERALMRQMNRARTIRGLKPLRTRASLHRAARKHSAHLAVLGRLEHDGPGGAPFWTRMVAAGYPARATMGENLALVGGCGRPPGYIQLRRTARAAANDRQARRVVRLWLNSPRHRANLLSPAFRFAGAGTVSDGRCAATVYTADYGG